MPKAILYDSTMCIGCKACEGAWRSQVICLTAIRWPLKSRLSAHKLTTIQTFGEHYSRRLCMHCAEPTCASVCPVGALHKTSLGPVVYDA